MVKFLFELFFGVRNEGAKTSSHVYLRPRHTSDELVQGDDITHKGPKSAEMGFVNKLFVVS